jgi:hypothetical protein
MMEGFFLRTGAAASPGNTPEEHKLLPYLPNHNLNFSLNPHIIGLHVKI